MDDNASSMREEARGRQVAYALLGRLFERELGLGDARSIGVGDGSKVLLALAESGIARDSIDTMVGSLRCCDENVVERLAVEYARLFCGHDRIHLHASCWLSDRPRLMGEAWHDVLDYYHDEGLVPHEEDVWMADQVGAELYFAAVLSGRVLHAVSAQEASSARDALADYLKTHVMTWVPRLFERVANDHRADFYADAAAIGLEFINVDARMLGIDTFSAEYEGHVEEVRR